MAIAQAMFKNADNNSPAAIAKLLKAAGISDEIIKEANERARAESSVRTSEKTESET
jgi:SOS response regulatory protein OraA/RecX